MKCAQALDWAHSRYAALVNVFAHSCLPIPVCPFRFAHSVPAHLQGLVLIECATGKYPYDASVGPLQLMIQVLNDDLPLPQVRHCRNALAEIHIEAVQTHACVRVSMHAHENALSCT